MMDYYQLASSSSCQESLLAIEADIRHANVLAASISRTSSNARLQMKLVYNHLAPLFLFLLQWMDFSCTCLLPSYLNLFHIVVYEVTTDGKQMFASHGRRATIREFYGVILPSLQCLTDNSSEVHNDHDKDQSLRMTVSNKFEGNNKHVDGDSDREDECGICLEPCTRMVLPNCCHAMCINCYRDWNLRSASCPFCRGSLKRVSSGDLWVLTCDKDVADQETLLKDELLRFYLYINSLPKDTPDALFLVYYEYLL
ncbi:hypothetical protein ACH5RR_025329 [Cinchona calisaya]|uniref:RING-type domain-containing protein n=1 Tax=Cinchona calisaya TaxID=153742 RepID=A0ABD2Z3D0_9GENT